jgi:acetyl esterase/lipase
MLDASAPEGNGPFPVAIIVHGGGWSGGDKKTDRTPLFAPLAEAKFAWFSINYRLAPDHKWPACLEDVRTAIREILKEIPPINHAESGLPPFLLVHGTEDKSVPLEQSLNFSARLKAAGGTCDLITIPGAPHRLLDWEKYDANYVTKVVTWLRQNLGVVPGTAR